MAVISITAQDLNSRATDLSVSGTPKNKQQKYPSFHQNYEADDALLILHSDKE